MAKPKIIYCSWSQWKIEEWECVRQFEFSNGTIFDDLVEIEFRKVATHEPLLRDLEAMVRHKAMSAYSETRVPCMVEHAGLILRGYEAENYPGGLTQPMWDALGAERFSEVCTVLGTEATARAVIGYCDGSDVLTFTGETAGILRSSPAGNRAFYWDTVFCPDGFGGASYAEIADGDLSKKLKVSQSVKALRKFLEYRTSHRPVLFPGL